MEDEELRKALKPVGDERLAAVLALRLFGLRALADSIKPLDSYDDLNFYLKAEGAEAGSAPGEFVLKVHNGVESRMPAFIEAQNAAMECAQGSGVCCQRPLRSLNGLLIDTASLAVADGSKSELAVRCLTFLPGKLQGDVPQSAELLADLGACIGRLDIALKAFEHQAACREHMWDLRQTSKLRSFLGYLEEERCELVSGVLAEFEAQVLPLAEKLRAQVIHADANDQNVIVDSSGLVSFL